MQFATPKLLYPGWIGFSSNLLWFKHCEFVCIIDECRSTLFRNKHVGTKYALNIRNWVLAFVKQVVVFDNKNTSDDASTEIVDDDSGENESGAAFLMRILRYLETPQYLRKSLFPKHNSLRFVVSI